MEVDRVVLTLEVALREETGASGDLGLAFGVLVAGQGVAVGLEQEHHRLRTHSLRIEFKPRGIQTPPAAGSNPCSEPGKATSRGEPAETESSPDRRVNLLTKVFGEPGGFYSHNRAEVFNGAVTDLSEAGYALLLAALGGQTIPPGEAAVALAYGQICNFLRSGPAGSVVRGSELLREAVIGSDRRELRRMIESAWQNAGLSSEA